MKIKVILSAFFILTIHILVDAHQLEPVKWGFFGHKRLNRLAVFTLPPEMIGFFKANIVYLTENAVKPDQRRYAVEGEDIKHYIDLDVYGDSALFKMPHRWEAAAALYTEDTLKKYGIAPWNLHTMYFKLRDAFKRRMPDRILSIAADLGHYAGDCNVPLHTTVNYNGQLTNQKGIHGFWESRLVEMYSDEYDFFVGKATYEEDVLERIWMHIAKAHLAMDSVLLFERMLNESTSEDKKYSFEQRNNITTQVYSKPYSENYHNMLNGMVERQMRQSIKLIADLWYTAWVDAGQPDLDGLISYKMSDEEKERIEREIENWKKEPKFRGRTHEH